MGIEEARGGAGGKGRIRIDAKEVSGTTDPEYYPGELE
jgi:hypothetical protein